jgi:hypothetical protein
MSDKTNASNKDVVYIDVDDEITGIIDKVRGSHSKIVALVLPKRASALQSVVNMKLLKRSAEEAKKNVVLITSESGLIPLAGSVGMFVAKTLQSKPEVPDAPARADSRPEEVDEDDVIEDKTSAESSLDKSRPVGELASNGGSSAVSVASSARPSAAYATEDDGDTIELDNDDTEPGGSLAADGATSGKLSKNKNKKLAVPNFNKFRLVLILGAVGLVALIVFGYFALVVMPKATISIKTNSQSLTSSDVITLKPGDGVTFSADDGVVPASSQQSQKTLSQQVDATGQQNNGEKATGSVTFSAGSCTGDVPLSLAAGSAITSSGLTFITQESADFEPKISGGKCTFKSGNTAVEAQKAGASYNVDPASFAVPGRSTVTGASSAKFSGGTDDITKIVTQADIDNATQKLGSQSADSIKDQLKTDLVNKGYFPVVETFTTGTPQTKTSVNTGDSADNVTVTQTIAYTMLGAKQDDLKKVIAADIRKKIDPKKQSILDYGLDDAVFGLQSQPDGGATVTMQATVIAGPDLQVADIKKQVAGKKANDAREAVKQNPGVTDVDVRYSPFWVSAIPKKESKITVTIQKPAVSSSSSNADDN